MTLPLKHAPARGAWFDGSRGKRSFEARRDCTYLFVSLKREDRIIHLEYVSSSQAGQFRPFAVGLRMSADEQAMTRHLAKRR